MNELDLLLAELVEAARQRRHGLRAAARPPRPGKINLSPRQSPRAPTVVPHGSC